MGEDSGGIIFEGTKGKLMAGLFGRNPNITALFKMKDAKLPKATRPFVERGSEGHQNTMDQCLQKGYGAYTSSSFDQSGPLTETVIMGNLRCSQL